jgi:hypothetical protein
LARINTKPTGTATAAERTHTVSHCSFDDDERAIAAAHQRQDAHRHTASAGHGGERRAARHGGANELERFDRALVERDAGAIRGHV